MRVLVSNDDGIDAFGLNLLVDYAHTITHDVWVVAPKKNMSGTSHSRIHWEGEHNFLANKVGHKKYTVDGTTVDCIRMALDNLMDKPPDIGLIGINHGSNHGKDALYSATVAGAIELSLQNIKAIAISQMLTREMYVSNQNNEAWRKCKPYYKKILDKIINLKWQQGGVLSVNFPYTPTQKIKGAKFCQHFADFIEHRGEHQELVDGFITIAPLTASKANVDFISALPSELEL